MLANRAVKPKLLAKLDRHLIKTKALTFVLLTYVVNSDFICWSGGAMSRAGLVNIELCKSGISVVLLNSYLIEQTNPIQPKV